jgi:hypothetical protein
VVDSKDDDPRRRRDRCRARGGRGAMEADDDE